MVISASGQDKNNKKKSLETFSKSNISKLQTNHFVGRVSSAPLIKISRYKFLFKNLFRKMMTGTKITTRTTTITKMAKMIIIKTVRTNLQIPRHLKPWLSKSSY